MPAATRVGGVEPLAGERAIGAEFARQARQKPGRPDIGKEADADLGHREAEPVAGHAVRAVHRDADAAAHDDAVDERDVGLAIALDAGIERVFVAEIGERLVIASGAPEIVERAQVAARREGALAARR